MAATDPTGRLVASATVRTDREIDDWLAGLRLAPAVVGIDAPLLVRNATGQRRAENLLARAFGRYGAAPYPSNLANPLFDPPRGRRLAERHGWHLDPRVPGSPAAPLALEVYPHPATIVLFGLDRVLPYKAGRGRTPDGRRAALAALVGHLAAVPELAATGLPRFRDLADAVDRATRHVHLERVEDEIDAVLCAHLAWLWAHRPGVLTTFGDPDEGCIVAPPPPAPRATRDL